MKLSACLSNIIFSNQRTWPILLSSQILFTSWLPSLLPITPILQATGMQKAFIQLLFLECWVCHRLFSSVQFSHSVVSDSLRPHESQHARPPCPSPTPGVHSDTSIESVMPSSHLILGRPLLLLPPIPPSIRVFFRLHDFKLCFKSKVFEKVWCWHKTDTQISGS